MDTTKSGTDNEFAALQSVFGALEPLDGDSRQRIFDYVAARLGISVGRGTGSAVLEGEEEIPERPMPEEGPGSEREFATLAELYDAAHPGTDKDRALVTAYWLQVCEGAESFVSFAVNKALKDLGHGMANVTTAFDGLKGQKPALVLQLRKAGKSKQARKTYKITR